MVYLRKTQRVTEQEAAHRKSKGLSFELFSLLICIANPASLVGSTAKRARMFSVSSWGFDVSDSGWIISQIMQ